MPRKYSRITALVLVLGLAAAACSSSGSESTTTTAAATTTTKAGGTTSTGGASTTTAAALSGSVNVSGSSTVEPISALVAEQFSAANPGVAVKVEGPGTGDGAKLFCNGEIDIADASRKFKDAEKELCATNGVEFIELQVGIDGITVLTNINDSTAPACLDTSDLYALMGPESTGFSKWSDANALAAEIGAKNAPYPDADLVITAPGEESGTYDTFIEFVVNGGAGGTNYTKPAPDGRGAEAVLRPDYVASANDNVIIEGIAGSPASLGFVGFAFYEHNTDTVRAFEISAGDKPCTAPTAATIADGSYPMSRPLFIYVSKKAAADKPEVAAFVDYYLSDAGLANVSGAGYVPLTDYAPVLAAWQGR
jgi:phosphate transport system substrate-binding protein